MKIFLHIGQSKTGTSAIQAYLTLNRGALAKQGILYPVVSVAGMPLEVGNHNALADSLVGLSRYPYLTAEQYFDAFFAEANDLKPEMMILSAEHFFGGEPRVWDVPDHGTYFELYQKKIERLAEFLNGHEVTLLVYLRPQIDWLASAISQTIRIEKLIRPEPIYQEDHQFFELVKPALMYYSLMKIWKDCLRPKEIMVVPYVRRVLHLGSSVADFMHRAKIEDVNLPFASTDLEVNLSVSREYIEVKKILNRTTQSKIQERVIIDCINALTLQSTVNTSYAISTQLARDVELFVADENEMLNREFVQEHKLEAQGNPLSIADPISQEEIQTALQSFKKAFRQPRFRFKQLSIATRLFLRDHAPFLHSFLHQFKRLYWRVRYKTQAKS